MILYEVLQEKFSHSHIPCDKAFLGTAPHKCDACDIRKFFLILGAPDLSARDSPSIFIHIRAFFGSANVRLGASSLSLCRHLALEFTLSLTRKLINVLNIYELFMRF